MSLLNSMKITQKLILAFLCVIGVSLLCTGMIYWQRSALETSMKEASHTRKILEGMDHLISVDGGPADQPAGPLMITAEEKRLARFHQSKKEYADELGQPQGRGCFRAGASGST